VEDVVDPDPTKRLGLHDRLVLEDVSFSYRTSTAPVVRHVDLTVEKGSSLALVGSSGAGKSTLVDLILGLQEPTAGRILVDGIPIDDDLPSWQRSIGLVSQDVTLLNGSLLRNIAFGVDEADIDRTRLEEAIHLAQLDTMIADLPEGLDTDVAERGARLSGGQRQRVAIARALYTVPDLLVLDEATSALDNEVEYELTKTIDSLHGSMTIIVIAHRLSTVRNCSYIAYLEEGEVVAMGTFDELRRSNAAFARLVELAEMGRADAADRPLIG
jgi:ABC-type multidrug transport system fused ATPase/permease subunit